MKIGNVEINPPLILAPMAGLTDRHFRLSIKKLGGIGLTISEIIPSEGLLRNPDRMAASISIAPFEHPVSLQISGSSPERMAAAAKICEEAGADIIDINMGCPVFKVTRGFSGAALMKEPEKAGRVINEVVKAVKMPVTVKIRSGWDDNNLNFTEIGHIAEDEGASAVTIHPRTRKQMFSEKSDWNKIAVLKDKLNIPVIGNGDIKSPEDAVSMFSQTGCDGIMIGRAAVKNPFIFSQTELLLSGGFYLPPTDNEIQNLIFSHMKAILEDESPATALHRMKVFIGKYTKGMKDSNKLRGMLDKIKEPTRLFSEVNEFLAKGDFFPSSLKEFSD